MKLSNTKPHYTIGILGGTGFMGQLFKNFFEQAGYKTLISSRSTKLTPEDCAKQSDIFIVSVPIEHTVSSIEHIAPFLKKNALLMDFCSLKSKVFVAMEKYAPCEFIASHPVFGPNITSFNNQVMVLCPQKKSSAWLTFIKTLFANQGMQIKITTAEKHDEMMAFVQGLIHSASINLAGTLQTCHQSYDEVKAYSSPIYSIVMDFAARILSQNSDLYADIVLNNDYTLNVLKNYRSNLDALIKIVEQNDKKAYIDFFDNISTFLGKKNKEDAQKRTEQYVNILSSF